MNKTCVGDSTIVFWAQKHAGSNASFNFEEQFPWFVSDRKDDPDTGIQAVKALYEAVRSGNLTLSSQNNFYVLALSPNAARISVRFFRIGTVRDFAEKIRQHFNDFEIVHGPHDPEYLSLYRILASTAPEYKMDNVPPNLVGHVVESVLDGTPYPQTLLQQCIRRIRAERHVNRARAAILKATLNRFRRFHNSSQKEVTMGLDLSNSNPAYRLGRLFAALEKIQEEAHPGLNATIRERFYGAASTSPSTVFPQLLKLKNHHVAKLDNAGRRINFEKLIGEIMSEISIIPNHLPLNEQAYFSVGYYHQRQDFFKKQDH